MRVRNPVPLPPYLVCEATTAQDIYIRQDRVESSRLFENESAVQRNCQLSAR
jgi:hypothetical protein